MSYQGPHPTVNQDDHRRLDSGEAMLGRLPLHVQISEMLVREIKAGRLLHGEKLIPERQLATDLDISVGTLRRALADLEGKGFLRRIQGSGNYIHDADDGENIYAFFHLELLRGGGLPTARALSATQMSKPPNLPPFGTGDEAFRIRRLRYLDGVDAAIEEVWLDGACASSLALRDLDDALYHYYRTRLGVVIGRVTDTVSIGMPPVWAPADFGLVRDRGWGYVERRSIDQHGKEVEFSRTWFDPGSIRYVSRWR